MFFMKSPKEKVLEMLAEASPETYLLQCCCFSPCASAGGLAGASEESLRAEAGVKTCLALALPHPRSLGCLGLICHLKREALDDLQHQEVSHAFEAWPCPCCY